MKYNNLSMIFGLLFAVGLGVLAYLCFILTIILSFIGIEWFVLTIFVVAGLAVSTLIGSCFAKRKIMVTFVIDIISLFIVLFVIIYLLAIGIFSKNLEILGVFGGVFLFGLLSTIFAILAKRKKKIKEDEIKEV